MQMYAILGVPFARPSMCCPRVPLRFFLERSFSRSDFYIRPLLLISDTREAGFVNAITSAGAVYSITQACTMGLLMECSCDYGRQSKDVSTDGQWEWGGCGDDVRYGYLKSKDFMDSVKKKRRKRTDLRTKLNLHNNEAGRLVGCT